MGKVWVITRNNNGCLVGSLAYATHGEALTAALEQLNMDGSVRDYSLQHDTRDHVWYVSRDADEGAYELAVRPLNIAVDNEGPF